MSLPSFILIAALWTVFVFVLGILVGNAWQALKESSYEDFPQAQEIPALTKERYKCGICGEPVKNARHDGLWRCQEHKTIA